MSESVELDADMSSSIPVFENGPSLFLFIVSVLDLHPLPLPPASQAGPRGSRNRRDTRLQSRLLHKDKVSEEQKSLADQRYGDQRD